MFPADKKRVESALASAQLPKGKVGKYKRAGKFREEEDAHAHTDMKQTWWHMCVYFSTIPWNLMSSLRLPSRCFWTTSALVLRFLRSSPLSESDTVASWRSRMLHLSYFVNTHLQSHIPRGSAADNIMWTWSAVSPGAHVGRWGAAMAGITCAAEEICTFAVCPPAPPNRPWRRRISRNSSTRNRGTPDSTRSCSHVCGRTRSRPWSTNTSPAPPTLTEVRLDAVTTAPCRAERTLQPVFLCRSHFSWRPLEFPDGSRDISGYTGPAGQVAGHDPTITPLLHQVLPQHIPNRSRLWPQLVDSLINRLRVTDDVFFFFPFPVSTQLVSSLACRHLRCTDSVCWPGAAAWSWTAGRANPQMKSPSLPTASPWRLRSSSRWLYLGPIKNRSSPHWKHSYV